MNRNQPTASDSAIMRRRRDQRPAACGLRPAACGHIIGTLWGQVVFSGKHGAGFRSVHLWAQALMGAAGAVLTGADKLLTALGRLFRPVWGLLERNGTVPERSEMNPKRREMNPKRREMNPKRSEMNPKRSEMNPERREMNPKRSEMNPKRSEMNPKRSEMNPKRREMNPQWLEMNPQEREIRALGQKDGPERVPQQVGWCRGGPVFPQAIAQGRERLPAGGRDHFPKPKNWHQAAHQPLTPPLAV